MAAINVKILNPADKTYLHATAIGSGVPATGDLLVTDVKKYPVGSTYIDATAHKMYFRDAVAAAAADWVILN